MNTTRSTTVLLASLLILTAGSLARAAPPDARAEPPGAMGSLSALVVREAGPGKPATAPPKKPRLRVTILKETTYITGPLRADGYVNYVAAINQAASAGVTPENNAAVLLCRAFGLSEIGADFRPRFFRMLGIDPPPEEGNYVVASGDYIERLVEEKRSAEKDRDAAAYREKLEKDFQEITRRPWSEKEFPEWARWLERNEEPLRVLLEATRRPRYYAPLLASPDENKPGMVIAMLLPVLQKSREAARLFSARAMFRLKKGQAEAAWQDLLACHRLARLVNEDPTLIGALVSIAIDGVACSGDARLVSYGNLQAEQARKMLADLKSLRPLPSTADKVDRCERYMFLDAVCTLARGGANAMDFMDASPSPGARGVFNVVSSLLIDWDMVLRMGNSWYDRMVEALRKPTHAERAQAMRAVEEDIKAVSEEVRDAKKLAWSFLAGESLRQTVSEQMGNVLVSLLLPAVAAARTAEDRAVTVAHLNQIGFALAAYRADHGCYPERLAALEPKYIDPLPADLFTGQPFRYKLEGEGFLMYSLGPNGKDNGGRVNYLDRDKAAEGEDTSEWDDYRLRIPPETD